MGDFSFSGGAKFSGNVGFSGGGGSGSWAGKQITIGGGTSTSKLGVSPSGDAADIVKPGLSDDVLQRLALLRAPEEKAEAEIIWGKPSKFQITEPDQPEEINYTTIVNTGGGGGVIDTPLGAELLYYDEYQRKEEEVRVENPDDPAQYVIVARCQWIVFKGREDGIFRAFIFNNPERA